MTCLILLIWLQTRQNNSVQNTKYSRYIYATTLLLMKIYPGNLPHLNPPPRLPPQEFSVTSTFLPSYHLPSLPSFPSSHSTTNLENQPAWRLLLPTHSLLVELLRMNCLHHHAKHHSRPSVKYVLRNGKEEDVSTKFSSRAGQKREITLSPTTMGTKQAFTNQHCGVRLHPRNWVISFVSKGSSLMFVWTTERFYKTFQNKWYQNRNDGARPNLDPFKTTTIYPRGKISMVSTPI